MVLVALRGWGSGSHKDRSLLGPQHSPSKLDPFPSGSFSPHPPKASKISLPHFKVGVSFHDPGTDVAGTTDFWGGGSISPPRLLSMVLGHKHLPEPSSHFVFLSFFGLLETSFPLLPVVSFKKFFSILMGKKW